MSESFQTQAIHAGYDPLVNGRIAAGVSDNLIRLSIGLEDVNDLNADTMEITSRGRGRFRRG